jgi:hypothetical protein
MNKKRRLFAVDQDSGEPRCYVGTIGEGGMICASKLDQGIKEVTIGLLDDVLCGRSTCCTIEFDVQEMTDAEVAELPDY